MARSAVLACLFALVLAAPASAQEADVAQARSLFEAGLAAARAEHWVEARDSFAQSLAISERPSTLLNLAGAQIQTGQLVEGAASYRRFLEIATGPREAAHRREAQSALHDVEERIPHLAFHIENLASSDTVRLDEHVLLPGTLTSESAVDPGPHDVTVLRGGQQIATQHVEVTEGLTLQIEMTIQPLVDPAAVVVAHHEEPMDEALAEPVPPQGGDDTVTWVIVGVAIGVVVATGITVGVVLGTQDQSPQPYQGNLGDGIIRF